jgi:predicted nucleic acid-binding protein
MSAASNLVVADTSPICYLLLIEQIQILPALYSQILIPTTVAQELTQPKAPLLARQWIQNPPLWLQTVNPVEISILSLRILDPGERDAIALSVDLQASLLLIDDREGREAAANLGLSVTGTLGVLDQAATNNLIDLPVALARLRATNFRASQALIDQILKADVRRKKV